MRIRNLHFFAAPAFLCLALGACSDPESTSTQSASAEARAEGNTEPEDAGAAGRVELLVDATNATISQSAGPGCLVCSVDNVDGVLDVDPEQFATAHLSLGLLGAGIDSDLSVTVELGTTVDPALEVALDPMDENSEMVSPSTPGFVISFPDVTLVSLSLLPSIGIETLKDGEVVNDPQYYAFGIAEFLALGIVGIDINNARVFLGAPASEPYDAIRLSLSGAVVDLLMNLNIHQVGLNGQIGSIEGDF